MVVSARRVLLSSVCRRLHPNCAQLAWCTPQSRWQHQEAGPQCFLSSIHAENPFCQRRINNILGPGVADLPCFPISRSWVESLPSSILTHSSRISQMVLVRIGQAKMETVSMRCHWSIGLSLNPRFKTSRCIGNRLILEDPPSQLRMWQTVWTRWLTGSEPGSAVGWGRSKQQTLRGHGWYLPVHRTGLPPPQYFLYLSVTFSLNFLSVHCSLLADTPRFSYPFPRLSYQPRAGT